MKKQKQKQIKIRTSDHNQESENFHCTFRPWNKIIPKTMYRLAAE